MPAFAQAEAITNIPAIDRPLILHL